MQETSLPHVKSSANDLVQELNNVRDMIAEASVIWIKIICKASQDALENYSKSPEYTRKSIWYAEDLLKACQEVQQPKMLDFIKKGNKQLLGYVSPEYFDKIPDNSKFKFKAWHFIAKPNVLATDALKAAVAGLSIIDCGVACQLVRYYVLWKLLGDERFNLVFSMAVGQLMNIGLHSLDDQPMIFFVRNIVLKKSEVGEINNRPIKVGQMIGFKGIEDYCFSHWKAINTICIDATKGNQKFCALGIDSEGKSEMEINQLLLDKYNNNEVNCSLLAPNNDKIAQEASLILARYSRKKAVKVDGFHNIVEELIPEIINDLIKLPLEQVSMYFVWKHPVNVERFSSK